MKTQGELSALLGNIKDTRRKLDGLLNAFKERERLIEKQKKEEQQKKAEAAAPVKQPLPLPPKEEEPLAPPKAAEEPVKEEKKEVKVEEPAPAVKPAEPVIRTRQFDATPSYIRGVMKPVPPRPPQSIARPSGPRGTQPPRTGASRPQTGGAKRPLLPRADMAPPPSITNARKPFDNKKKEHAKQGDDKKGMNKRTLIRKGFIQEDFDEERMGTRKLKNRKQKEQHVFVPTKIEKAVITTENLTVKILSEKIGDRKSVV